MRTNPLCTLPAQLGDIDVLLVYTVLSGSEKATLTCPASAPSVELVAVEIAGEQADPSNFATTLVNAWTLACITEAIYSELMGSTGVDPDEAHDRARDLELEAN